MHPDLQVQLVRRVLVHVEQRTTDSAPTEIRLGVEAYTDEVRYAREQQRLFRELPIVVAHASQVPSPGDFVTHDHSGIPILVARGDDGELRAFINVCRHRGTRVESQPCGSRKAFVCPYHAWSYRRDGSLLAIPHERGFPGIDPAQHGLVRLPLGEIAGLVFVRPSPLLEGEPAGLDLASWLGPIAADLEGFGLATSHVYAPFTTARPLSWKLAIDVFLETYHLKTAHKGSIYPLFFDNLGLVDRFGAHLRNVFPKRSIRELATRPEREWSLRKHANVLFHLFPNTLILIEPDHAAVLHLWPRSPSEILLESYTLVPEAVTTDKARAYWDANNDILHGAIAEDFALGESIQRGLASGANREVTFGSFEHALTHFHAQCARLGR